LLEKGSSFVVKMSQKERSSDEAIKSNQMTFYIYSLFVFLSQSSEVAIQVIITLFHFIAFQ